METNERIIFEFTNHLREHGRYPESVYLFCRGLGIEEKAFFAEFGSFQAVESGFGKTLSTGWFARWSRVRNRAPSPRDNSY